MAQRLLDIAAKSLNFINKEPMPIRIIRTAPAALSVLILCLTSVIASGQTEEQLRQFEELTPAQRDLVLQTLEQNESQTDAPVSEPELVTPRRGAQAEYEGSGGSGLRPFGYDLFAGEPSTFAPATDIPVPTDYVIGPGDTIGVQLFGGQNAQYSLVVTREGNLHFPEIGPIAVAGLSYSDTRQLLQQRVQDQMIGVTASISMGPLRSIRIFVLGDAHRPGSYTVSALSTMTNALFVSGGISSIGSLRKVELRRDGRLVTTLDLYDLLLRGDTSADARLQPGDVIFIPPVAKTVGVDGEVRRPAIYEIRKERTVAEILRMAGGLLPTAFPQASRIERINEARDRTVVDVDLSSDAGLATLVSADDTIRIFSVLEKREDIVVLDGHINRQGSYQWKAGMRLTDLIESPRALQPKADLGYVLIRRELENGLRIDVLSANLAMAFSAPGSANDVELQPRDVVTVFDIDTDRSPTVEPVLQELSAQAVQGEPSKEVRVAGRVRVPGRFPLEAGMRVSDLLRAGGSLDESAYPLQAELTRFYVQGGESRQTELLEIDLAAVLRGDSTADLVLSPYDVLNIKEMPNWSGLELVEIAGEVRFAGRFTVRRGERLSSLLQRAGGLNDLAFPDGAIFLREELRLREEQQLQELAERLEADVDQVSIERDETDAVADARRSMLARVRRTQATGRLVIDLSAVLSGDESADVILRDGDRILIPKLSQTVTVIGEVQFPTSHLFEDGAKLDEYIGRSGGTTSDADDRRIYVVGADGAVAASGKSRFFRNRNNQALRSGDTIVVPLDADRISSLALWTSVTTSIYNIAVAAAAVASFL